MPNSLRAHWEIPPRRPLARTTPLGALALSQCLFLLLLLDGVSAPAAAPVLGKSPRYCNPLPMVSSGASASGDVTVIRDYLGHASVVTTNRYINTNVEMKRDALQALWLRAGLARRSVRRWRPAPNLIAFLSSL